MSEELTQCPVTGWFKFKGGCDITTCMYHTDSTARKCLQLDRRATLGPKNISDAELSVFKFKSLHSPRLVSYRRTKAVQRITAALLLRSYIPWIRDNCPRKDIKFVGAWVEKIEGRPPLRIKRLKFENWMWQYIVDEDTYNAFASEYKKGECSKLKVWEVIATSQSIMQKLQREIRACVDKARAEKVALMMEPNNSVKEEQ